MKRSVIALPVALLIMVCAFLSWHKTPPAPMQPNPGAFATPTLAASVESPTHTSTPPDISSEAQPPSQPADSSTAGSPLAAELNSPQTPPERDVEILHTLLREYLHHLHHRQGLPIGDDIDLARVLTGHNPMKLVILPPNHPALSPDGHIRDRWGTPYFVHPRGNNAFEIRSAGPDRKLFTADDLVAHPATPETSAEPE